MANYNKIKTVKHIKTFESFLNETFNLTEENEDIQPNNKLNSATGFPYAMFYLSTQAENIMIDFENPKHIEIIKLLADESKTLKEKGELSSSDMQKGRNLFKKALGQSVNYGKYEGADCTYRLSTTPTTDLTVGKKQWFDKPAEMANFI